MKSILFVALFLSLPCLVFAASKSNNLPVPIGSAKRVSPTQWEEYGRNSPSVLPIIDELNKRGRSIKVERINYHKTPKNNWTPAGKPRPVRDIVPNRQSSYPISKPIGSR